MAITLFGAASIPTDNGTNTTNPTAFANPPIASMVAGDLVFVYGYCRTSSATLAVSNAGGQSWTSGTSQSSANATLSANFFWCRFNGTWSAAPSFSFGATTNNNVVMLVFRPTSGTMVWDEDGGNTGSFVDKTSASIFTITGWTTQRASTVSIAVWNTGDDNTWGALTSDDGNWVKTSLSAQYRNTSGNDTSSSFAYNIKTATGTTGTSVSQNLTANGPDGGFTFSISFYESAPNTNFDVVQATYTFTTEAAGLQAQRKLDVTNAVYTFTGADVTFNKGYNFPVVEAVYSFTPADVTFAVTRMLIVTPAVYSFTTQDAGIQAQRKLDVTEATYSFTTADAGLTAQRKLDVTNAVYSFTPQDAGLLRGLRFNVDPASYSFTTADASILAQRTLSGTEAVYLFNTEDAGLEYTPGSGSYNFDVDNAVYSFTTADASLTVQRLLNVDPASYSFTTQDASILAQRTLSTDNAVYVFTTQDAELETGGNTIFDVTPASYVFSNETVGLTKQSLLSVLPAVYLFTGSDISFGARVRQYLVRKSRITNDANKFSTSVNESIRTRIGNGNLKSKIDDI